MISHCNAQPTSLYGKPLTATCSSLPISRRICSPGNDQSEILYLRVHLCLLCKQHVACFQGLLHFGSLYCKMYSLIHLKPAFGHFILKNSLTSHTPTRMGMVTLQSGNRRHYFLITPNSAILIIFHTFLYTTNNE